MVLNTKASVQQISDMQLSVVRRAAIPGVRLLHYLHLSHCKFALFGRVKHTFTQQQSLLHEFLKFNLIGDYSLSKGC